MKPRWRRRLVLVWRDHAILDAALSLLGLTALLAPEPSAALVQTFAGAAAAVLTMFSAIVTFALGFLFQSSAPRVIAARQKHRTQLGRAWRWCVTAVLLGTLVQLMAVWFAAYNPQAGLAISAVAIVLALMATIRALDLFSFTVTASAID